MQRRLRAALCVLERGAGGHDSTNDSSPEVLAETDFLQAPAQIQFIFFCQGDVKVSVDCNESKNVVNVGFFCW